MATSYKDEDNATVTESTVTVAKERFLELINCESKINCLECGGVDSWDGYCESLYPSDDDGYGYSEAIDISSNGPSRGTIKFEDE